MNAAIRNFIKYFYLMKLQGFVHAYYIPKISSVKQLWLMNTRALDGSIGKNAGKIN